MFPSCTSSDNYDSFLGNQAIDQSTSASISETESLNAGQQPPEVKIEVVDDTYYQYTDSSKISDGYVHKRKITDYTSTVAVPQLPASKGDKYPTTNFDHPSAACINEMIHSTDHPRTIAVPVRMHSTPEDLLQVEKRRGRPPNCTALNPVINEPESSDSKSAETKEEKSKRGRRCKNHGTTVEYVYPKRPVIERRKWHKNNLVSLLKNKTLPGEKKAGKDVIDGLRIRLQPNKDKVDGNKEAGKGKSNPGVKKQNKRKKDYAASECESRSANDPDKKDANATRKNNTNEKQTITDSGKTDNKANKTPHDQDSEAEKNEQMLFLGLTKTIDEDKRRLEEQSDPKANTRRLRSRKRVNYSKDDSADWDDLEEVVSPSCKKVAKKQKTTAVGEDVVNEVVTSKGKKTTYPSTVAVKKGIADFDDEEEDKMYFPPAGIVPEGTRSRYAQGSFMKTKFVTESIHDRAGNVTVISKRVPVRPRQFGIDERLKNRPAIYICHPTAPVINPNTRAPTKLAQK